VKGVVGGSSGWGITTLSDNSTVVTGQFSINVIFGEGEPNQTVLTSSAWWDLDIFIARYNPDGTLAWAKRAGGTSGDKNHGDVGKGITALSDNSTVVTGWFYESATFGPGEPNETVLTSAGIEDMFIARYKSDGTLAWAKSAGGVSFDEAQGITTLSDNSTVATGFFSGPSTFGPGEPNETVLTGFGLFIAHYNPDGTLAWAKRAEGSLGGDGITALSDNSTVVTGDFMKPNAKFGPGEANETVLTCEGGFDIFIARYNPDGTLAWAKRAGNEDDYTGECESGYGITTLSDNSTVATGEFRKVARFGPGEPNETLLQSAGVSEIFIARFEP
jgi:hypothetical protein